MRILRVIASMSPQSGGPAQGIRNMVPEMKALGWDNDVVCLDDSQADFGMQDPFPVIRIGAGRGPLCYHPALTPWLQKNLVDYDYVLVHGLWLYPSYCVTKVMRDLRRKGNRRPRFLVMPHGMLDPWFQTAPSRRWKARRNWLYWKFIENRTVSEADGLLFTCQRELELARETFRPYKPKREMNVGYGIAPPPPSSPETERAFLNVSPSLEGKPYLLFLSRIDPKKGVDLLVDAYLKVHKQYRDRGDTMPDLVIAGPNDTPFARELIGRTLDCPSIHWPGMLLGSAKWGALHGSEAFVLPSHQENFGIAVVEAMACGKPVLISDQVNIFPEVAGVGAGLIESDTAEGVRNLLTRWITRDEPSRRIMQSNAVTGYKRHFAADAAARTLADSLLLLDE